MARNYAKTKIMNFVKRNYMRLYGIFHKVEKKVLFISFSGKQYSDNPRAISEKLHALYPAYEIVWAFNESAVLDDIPDYIKPVVKKGKFDFHFYRELATAFCYVTNYALGTDIWKRNGQFFIQTWHGDVGMKNVLYDAWRDGKRPMPVMDEKYTDLCISGSDLSEKKYHSAFRYFGEILKVGTPRNDKLMIPNVDEEKRTRTKLGIPERAKVLVFAPTFRDGVENAQDVIVDLHTALEILGENGEEWVCLVRAHSASAGLNFACDGKRFVDASGYPDLYDLLAISDMLITDYSSCAGDLIRCGKPVILALFDKEAYEAKHRELYFDPEKAGFTVAHDQEELNEILRTRTEADDKEHCEKLMEYFGIVETGHASEAVCNRIHAFYKGNYTNQA